MKDKPKDKPKNRQGNPEWVAGGPSPNPNGQRRVKKLRKYAGEETTIASKAKDGKTTKQTQSRDDFVNQALFKMCLQEGPKQLGAIELWKAYVEGRPVETQVIEDKRPPRPVDLSFLSMDDLKQLRTNVAAAATGDDDDDGQAQAN